VRFLHTSDWHLGKGLRHLRRDDEFHDVLAEMLDIVKREKVDCLLVAGDLFDSVAPSAEAERLAFDFFRELVGHGVSAVIIAGNHDHPRRLDAFGRVLDLVGIHVRAEFPSSGQDSLVYVRGRNGQEAVIAALPWLPERRVRSWEALQQGQSMQEYAEIVAGLLEEAAAALPKGYPSIVMAHIFVDGAVVGGEGAGERTLHLGQIYAVSPQRLPRVDYLALGHLHRAQKVRQRPPVVYSGSILQLDFGEVGQKKCVYLVDVRPGQEAQVEEIPLTKFRPLHDLGSPKTPLTLEQVRAAAKNSALSGTYLRIFVKADSLVTNLIGEVRKALPQAVAVVPVSVQQRQEGGQPTKELSPVELFSLYYKTEHGKLPPQELVQLFLELLQEVHEAP